MVSKCGAYSGIKWEDKFPASDNVCLCEKYNDFLSETGVNNEN